jgi:hypothetical protein
MSRDLPKTVTLTDGTEREIHWGEFYRRQDVIWDVRHYVLDIPIEEVPYVKAQLRALGGFYVEARYRGPRPHGGCSTRKSDATHATVYFTMTPGVSRDAA